jgi:hypothetical protein
MKKGAAVVLSILFCVLVLPQVAFSVPYDDFQGASIDKEKWQEAEFVKEIRTEVQKLHLRVATPNPVMMPTFPYTETNYMGFNRPVAEHNAILGIQAEVSVIESEVSESGEARASLGGRFYNDGTGDYTGRGDIWAEISIVRNSSGPSASWLIGRFDGSDHLEKIASGSFKARIKFGARYNLSVSYDPSVNRFTFRLAREQIVRDPSSLPDLPPWVSDPGRRRKGLFAEATASDQNSMASLWATFDNVYVLLDGDSKWTLYDNFSNPVINENIWTFNEFVREISAGQFRSKVRTSYLYGPSTGNPLEFVDPSPFHIVQADVTPVAYDNNEGADAAAGLAGYFYSDGTGSGNPGDHTGDVGAEIWIGGTGTTPEAGWTVWRATDFSGSASETVETGTFLSIPISFGNSYKLFLQWTGSQFNFEIEDGDGNFQMQSYSVSEPIHPPNVPWKEIGTRILDPTYVPSNGAKAATVDALFDNVYAVADEIVTVPLPQGPVSGIEGGYYSYSATGGFSNLDHPVQYRFDWGDGSDTGWLPVGQTSAFKSWVSLGNNDVRVMARCANHPSVESVWSSALTVNIVSSSITLQSPANGQAFGSGTLINSYEPPFSWNTEEAFNSYTILFSNSPIDFETKGILITKAGAKGTSWTPPNRSWKSIMTSSHNGGTPQDIYWKVVGTRPDRTTAESNVNSFRIDDPQPVVVIAPQEGDSLPSDVSPTFAFSPKGNVKFKLEFCPSDDFLDPKKIKGFNYRTGNPNQETVMTETLTSTQWGSIKKLLGVSGHFRIKAWDGIKRETVSETRSFRIQSP